MASEKSPAFQFYPRDFIADSRVQAMSLKERGVYITLICHCWTDVTLPLEHERLARLVGLTMADFRKVWPAIEACFVVTDDGLAHKRLEVERKKQADHRERSKQAAGKRWAS